MQIFIYFYGLLESVGSLSKGKKLKKLLLILDGVIFILFYIVDCRD